MLQDDSQHGGNAYASFMSSSSGGGVHKSGSAAAVSASGGAPIKHYGGLTRKKPTEWDLEVAQTAVKRSRRWAPASRPGTCMHMHASVSARAAQCRSLPDPHWSMAACRQCSCDRAVASLSTLVRACPRRRANSIFGLPLISPLTRPYKSWTSFILLLDLIYTAFLM